MPTSTKFKVGDWVTSNGRYDWRVYGIECGIPFQVVEKGAHCYDGHGKWVWLKVPYDWKGKPTGETVGFDEDGLIPLVFAPMPEPDMTLDEIQAAQDAYSALTQDKPRT